MKIRHLITASALAAAVTFPLAASADTAQLGEPIVELMPIVKQLGPQLKLTAEQKAKLDAWAAEAPTKRKQLEAETMQLRAQLRDAILDGADRMTRESLKAELAAKQTRLIEMRSLCTRMLRQTLNPEQFAKVVATYRAG